jgi:hypothetical protein
MEITRLPDIQPDRDRSKRPIPRRRRGAPVAKTPPPEAGEQAPEGAEKPPEPPADTAHHVDVTV